MDLNKYWASEPAGHTTILVAMRASLLQSFVAIGENCQKATKRQGLQREILTPELALALREAHWLTLALQQQGGAH